MKHNTKKHKTGKIFKMPKPKKQKGPNFSGRKPGQGVPLALAAVRHKTYLQELRKTMKCKHCGDIAMRGQEVCRIHGGASVAARRGEYVSSGKFVPEFKENQNAIKEMRETLEKRERV